MLSPLDPSLLLDCLLPPLLQPPGSAAGGETPRGRPRDPPPTSVTSTAGCRLGSSEAGLAFCYGEANSNTRKKSPPSAARGKEPRLFQEIRRVREGFDAFFLFVFFSPPNLLRKAGGIFAFSQRGGAGTSGVGRGGAERRRGALGLWGFPSEPPPPGPVAEPCPSPGCCGQGPPPRGREGRDGALRSLGDAGS